VPLPFLRINEDITSGRMVRWEHMGRALDLYGIPSPDYWYWQLASSHRSTASMSAWPIPTPASNPSRLWQHQLLLGRVFFSVTKAF